MFSERAVTGNHCAQCAEFIFPGHQIPGDYENDCLSFQKTHRCKYAYISRKLLIMDLIKNVKLTPTFKYFFH